MQTRCVTRVILFGIYRPNSKTQATSDFLVYDQAYLGFSGDYLTIPRWKGKRYPTIAPDPCITSDSPN
jgi:hypothetical protein